MMFISDDVNNTATDFEIAYRIMLGLSPNAHSTKDIAKEAEKNPKVLILDLYCKVVFAARNAVRVGTTSREIGQMLGRAIDHKRIDEDAWH